ncbi:MAG: hypothetical protein CXZ00_12365 [Acidobacteria bacterium]|nr:MAG: hypothetical protein CXZ00_12365 [Acidobacteriota bacterium]
MRTVGLVVVVLVVLVVAALLIVPHFVDVNTYRGAIESRLQQKLNRPVELGQMSLGLLPPRFKVDNASIGEDPQFGHGQFATVQHLAISVQLLPLLHKDIEISSLTLQRPHVELIRNQQGVWNFSTLAKPSQQQPSEQAAQPAQPSQPAPQQPSAASSQQAKPSSEFQLDHLKIKDGQVAVIDQQDHSHAVYDHIDADLKNFAPDKQFAVKLNAHLPGQGTQTISLDGTVGPLDQKNMILTPVDATLNLNSVSLAGVQQFLKTQELANTNGVVSGKAAIKNQGGNLWSSGNLRINNAVVHGVNVGYPISVDFKAGASKDLIRIEQGNVRLGSTPLAVTGTVNTQSKPTQIDMKLNAQNMSLVEAARLAAAFGVAFNANTKVTGFTTANVTAKGAVTRPALNGTVSTHDLVITGNSVPAPVKIPSLDLALTPEQIRSGEFTASAGNTSLGGQFTLSHYTTASPLVNAALHTNGAQISDLLSMARAYGASAANDMSGSGLLSLNVQVAGPVKDASAMEFSGTGQVQNASLKTPTLKVPINVRNANLSFSKNGAQIENLAASLGQTDASGKVTVHNFAAPDLQFLLTANKVNVTELQQISGSVSSQPRQKTAGLTIIPSAFAAEPPNAGSNQMSPMLSKMTGGGTVQIGTVQYDQLTLTNAHANITLNHGLIGISPLTAQLYGGSENGSVTIDTRATPMIVQAKSNLQGVDANGLLSAVSPVKDTIYGHLAANTQLSFQATNSNDIARTLNGTLGLHLTDGRITKLDLLNQLAAVGKFAGVRQNAQAVTEVAKLDGHFDISNGVASTNDLTAEIINGTLASKGTVNLATKDLAMHATAVMSKGFTEQVGANGVGGLMQTALANNQGELVIPVIITGTFDHPQVQPDLQQVAEMKLKNLLPTTSNPAAMTSSMLGNLVKGGGAGAGQTGGLGGIVGELTGHQNESNQTPSQSNPPSIASPQAPPQRQPANQQQDQGNDIKHAIEGIFGGKK